MVKLGFWSFIIGRSAQKHAVFVRKYGCVEGVGVSGRGQTAGTADGLLIESRETGRYRGKGSERVIPLYVGLRYAGKRSNGRRVSGACHAHA